jgi:cell division protein FtsL
MQRVAAYEQEQVAIKTERATRATSQEMTTQPRLVTQPEPSTTVVQMPRSSNRLLLTLVAASILVLAGVTLYWTNQVMQLQREQNDLIALLAAAPATTNEVDPPPARIALSGPNHHRELLPAEDVAAGASARFVWNAEDQVGAVFATGLPPLPDDQVYQVWVVTLEGESLSLGTFEINEDGDGALVFAADEPIQDYTHIGISTEQRGGSLTPTTPHLVIGVI